MIRQLAPGAIARTLFGIDPDRDEKASQLCAEALLTLVQNDYAAPAELSELCGPKRRQYAVRSLALGQNFLEAIDAGRVVGTDLAPQAFGERLAAGADFQSSANLLLAREALAGLVDPDASGGQPGGWLLRPFHESLLWFDARRERGRPWRVRQVYMRGSGITLARMLMQPPEAAGAFAKRNGEAAVAAIRESLQAPSPLGHIADGLEAAMPEELSGPIPLEDPEREAWVRGGSAQLATLAERICRHAEGIMLQGNASDPAKLWQLRTVLSLDLACHALRTAWSKLDLGPQDRFLLLTFGGPPRRDNRVRQLSEQSYQDARQQLRRATVATLATEMSRIAAEEEHPQWEDQLENRRGVLSDVVDQLREVSSSDNDQKEFERLARLATDTADYGRAAEGFRVLITTVGLLGGTGAYRYLTAPPELLAAMVGALSAQMPMTSAEFFRAMRDEWGFVVDSSAGTRLVTEVDGSDLHRSARRAEQNLVSAGLAVSLSDQTVVVGERAARGVQ